MNQLYSKTFYLLLLVFFFSSCNSKVGFGITQNRGNLLLDKQESIRQERGYFLEYQWVKKLDRSSIGIDYSIIRKGYGSRIIDYENSDRLLHAIQGKYYYSILQESRKPISIDLSIGVGVGGFPLMSNELITPLATSFSADIYFLDSKMIYLSPRLSYIRNFTDKTQNTSFGVSLGVFFTKR